MVVLPTTQFAYRKGLGTYDANLCVSHALQNALESGEKARIKQIDFCAPFDKVNLQGILFKLCSVYWRLCVVNIDTVSVSPITAPYGG